MSDLIYKEECFKIIGACMEVYNQLGCGFLEAVYHEALTYELEDRGIPFESEVSLKISFKNRTLNKRYSADFLIENKIILEIKAEGGISQTHRSQTLNYLNATGYKLGLVINFGESDGLKYQCIVL